MGTTEELQSQVQEQRQTLQQRQQEASQVQSQLEEAQSSLPEVRSQRSLRERFAGLTGRRQRKIIENVKSDVSTQIKEVEDYKTELANYEKEVLVPAEQQIQEIQQQEAEYNAEMNAYNTARKYIAYDSSNKPYIKVPTTQLSGRVRYYAEEIANEANASAELNAKLEEVNAGKTTLEKALPNFEKLKRSGVLKVTQTESPSSVLTPSDQFQSIVPELSREEKNKFQSIPKGFLSGYSVAPINAGTVSAQTTQYQTLAPKFQAPVISQQYMTIAPPRDYKPTIQIDSRTGKPFGEVKAYNPKDFYFKTDDVQKEKGFFNSIPILVGEAARRVSSTVGDVIFPNQYQSNKEIALKNIKKGGEVGTYFVNPEVSATILVGAGVEEYSTKAGRARIKTTEEFTKEYLRPQSFVGQTEIQRNIGLATKSPNFVGKAIAYGIPASEIALGYFGQKAIRLNVNKPIVRNEPLIVDVEYNIGKGVAGKGEVRNVGVDAATGQAVSVESGIPIAYIKDVGVEGRKSIFTTRLREKFGMKPIYSGLPSQRVSKDLFGFFPIESRYDKAIRLLEKQGYTNSQSKQLLRQIKPQYRRITGQGKMALIQKGDESPIRFFAGEETTTWLSGEKGGVKFLERKPQKIFIREEAKNLESKKTKVITDITGTTKSGKARGITEEQEFDIIGFERTETKPRDTGERLLPEELVSGAGKRTATYRGAVGVKADGEIAQNIPLGEIDVFGTPAFQLKPEELVFEKYKTAEISKKIIPKEYGLLEGDGIAYVQKGEPLITVFDESVKTAKGFMGGGSKSSPQFLENLYQTTEKAKAETTLGLLKTKSIRIPSIPKSPSTRVSSLKTVELFHGTTSESAEKALVEGLKPASESGVSRGFGVSHGKVAKLKEVYLTPDKAWADSWAGRAVYGKGSSGGLKPVTIKATIPKSEYEKLFIRRGIEKGGGEEITLTNVPPKYLSKVSEGSQEPIITIEDIVPKTNTGRIKTVAIASGATGLNIVNPSVSYGKYNVVSGLSNRNFGGASDQSNILGSSFGSGRSKALSSFEAPTTAFQSTGSAVSDFSTTTTRDNTQFRIFEAQDNTRLNLQVNERQKAFELTKPSEKVSLKVEQSPIQSEKTSLKQLQELNQKQTQKQTQESGFKKPSQKNQKNPRTPRFKFEKETIKERTPKEILDDFYKVYTKKKGQDVEIGTFKTESKAGEELFKVLRKELRASGYVTSSSGKKVRLKLFGTEFTPSKRDSFRVVQPREKRLSAKSEVSEIKFFKKQKGKRKSSWGF